MSESRKPGGTLEPGLKRRAGDRVAQRRSTSERFANLSDRLARSLPASVRGEHDEEPAPGDDREQEETFLEVGEDPGSPVGDPGQDDPPPWYDEMPRFPIARSGYECAAVDAHVTALERELADLDGELSQLRARTPSQDEVAAELKRVGDQTSAILIAAHDRANETTRQAQQHAERTVAEATARARAMTTEAERRRDELAQETAELAQHRAALLADLAAVAGKISAVAQEGATRFEPHPRD